MNRDEPLSADRVTQTFCTPREAAAMLGVSIGTVQSWAENGQLEAWTTAGGHRRVLLESVERLRRRPGDETPVLRPAARRPTVIVVEDDVHLLRLYEARISRWPRSPQVICVTSAVLALLRIGRQAPDMLILDLNIPGMDGFAMLHALRQSGAVQDTAIAVVTGMDEAAIEAQGGLPADIDIFRKPVPFDRLLAVWNPSAEVADHDSLQRAHG